MDVRHGICSTWRRSCPAPVLVRTCTPGSPLAPVQRRTRLSSRQAAQPVTSASPAVAMGAITMTTAEMDVMEPHDEPCQGPTQDAFMGAAVLQTRLSKAHASAASAALVVQDTPDEKLVATASLDKGMAIWRFYTPQGETENGEATCEEAIEVTRLKVPGAPVFSLEKIPDVLPDGTIVRKRQKPSGIYIGTASKEVLTWMLGSKDIGDKVVLDGHTGWVRSLSVTGKWLFSCGCNSLRQWDTTFRTPKESAAVRTFTGDILAIGAASDRVFTAGADGSLRSWLIVSRTGALEEGPRQERAHAGRVAACVAAPAGLDRVFTVSYDGSIKAWSATTLELVAEARGAHRGDKIFCAAVGPNRVLFTGGDDQLIRAWDMDLNPVGPPLDGHAASVRVLAAGRRGLLVSGDSEGDVCIWETTPVSAAAQPTPLQFAGAPSAAVAAATQMTQMNGSSSSGSELTLMGTESDLDAVAAAAAAALGRHGGEGGGSSSGGDGMGGAAAAAAAGAVEVCVGEAAMQQLESLFASAAAASNSSSGGGASSAPSQQGKEEEEEQEGGMAQANAWEGHHEGKEEEEQEQGQHLPREAQLAGVHHHHHHHHDPTQQLLQPSPSLGPAEPPSSHQAGEEQQQPLQLPQQTEPPPPPVSAATAAATEFLAAASPPPQAPSEESPEQWAASLEPCRRDDPQGQQQQHHQQQLGPESHQQQQYQQHHQQQAPQPLSHQDYSTGPNQAVAGEGSGSGLVLQQGGLVAERREEPQAPEVPQASEGDGVAPATSVAVVSAAAAAGAAAAVEVAERTAGGEFAAAGGQWLDTPATVTPAPETSAGVVEGMLDLAAHAAAATPSTATTTTTDEGPLQGAAAAPLSAAAAPGWALAGGQEHGLAGHANGHAVTNGHLNGANGHVNGFANGHLNGHGGLDGHAGPCPGEGLVVVGAAAGADPAAAAGAAGACEVAADACEVAPQPPQQPPPPPPPAVVVERRIEVDNVAAAVAASCLDKRQR